MTNALLELSEDITGTIHWRSEVLERHPDDIRNRIAMHRLNHLKEQLQTINDPDLELALDRYHGQDMSHDLVFAEPVIGELLKQVGFSWHPTIVEFTGRLKEALSISAT